MTRSGRRLAGGGLVALSLVLSACSSSATPHSTTAAVTSSTTPAPTPTLPAPAPSSSAPTLTDPTAPASPHRRPTSRVTSTPSTSTPSDPKPSAAKPRASALPLPFATGSATQVITAVAPSRSSTHGVLQTWRKVSGGWRTVGPAVAAWFGADGLSEHPSETKSATPIGSFTLTQAFGHNPDPGTAMPYVHTTPDDWWISQGGPLYNTRQRCAAHCPFMQGGPNERLYLARPFYDYAVVIDYNTRNAPGGVKQGAGSAFFLHVTVGEPTAGCISIAKAQLVRILRWLHPQDAPRILIGVR